MKVDFVRFEASDGVELQGWLSECAGDTAVLHIHGMSGNGYENRFLDYLRETCVKNGITFFSIDTRGRGVISDFQQGDKSVRGGSCYEIFEESTADILGALNFLKSLGKTKFILEGHSLGCSKVVNYQLNNPGENIEKLILLAPTDMCAWAGAQKDHQENLAKAKKLVAEDRLQELVGFECWVDKTPISAATYLSICEEGRPVDIYGQREGGTLLGRLNLPVLVPYGDIDGGITMVEERVENWLKRVEALGNNSLQIEIIKGAKHSYTGHEQELAEIVERFIN